MRILLISQAYPPYPIVGAFRARRIARAFSAAGHEVVVVTERLTEDLEAKRPRDPGVEVRAVTVGPRYRERVTGLLARVRGRRRAVAPVAGEPLPEAAERPTVSPRRGFFHRLVLALLWMPDDEQRFIRPVLQAARDLMPSTDLIYTTAPSWSTQVAGLLLHRRWAGRGRPIRWVADYRDPWIEIVESRSDRPRTGFTDGILRRLEQAVLRKADLVVAVADRTRVALAAKRPASERAKFIVARNGIDVVQPPRLNREPGPFRIVYTGSFYDDRDPRLFLRALARLRAERPISPDDLQVDFAGACRTLGTTSIEQLVTELGLADLVRFYDWMPQSEARRLLERADLLLILARGMELQVPNKLYDYLGMRLPILAWADEGGETAVALQAIGGHFVVTSADVEDMASTLRRALGSAPAAIESSKQDALLEEWSAERQMTRLVEAVGASVASR